MTSERMSEQMSTAADKTPLPSENDAMVEWDQVQRELPYARRFQNTLERRIEAKEASFLRNWEAALHWNLSLLNGEERRFANGVKMASE